MKRAMLMASLMAVVGLMASQAAAQNWVQAQPLYGTHTLTSGFLPDPQAIAVMAGGAEAPQVLGAPAECNGMITAAQPDVRVMYTAGTYPLSFFVNSTADSTLIINAPDGAWHCNDDTNSLNPMVRFDAPPSGQYDIWVGLYGASSPVAANLIVSEMAPMPYDCTVNAQSLPGEAGASHFVVCPGGCDGATIWGTGVYSDDSSVCAAAVHAGVVPALFGGVVQVSIAPGQEAYMPSVANGVSSNQWGAWGRSFTVAPTGLGSVSGVNTLECGTTATALPGDPGVTHRLACPAGCIQGSVWGTGIYSDDSSVCMAAIHAGVLNQATGGELTVTIAPGQDSYPPSTANGVTTSQWGAWSRSFTVAP